MIICGKLNISILGVVVVPSVAPSVNYQNQQTYARLQHIKQCETLEKSFNAQTAPIVEKQNYADCINLLHTKTIELSNSESYMMNISATITIITVILFLIVGYRKGYFGLYCMGSIPLAFFTFIIVFVVMQVGYIIFKLF